MSVKSKAVISIVLNALMALITGGIVVSYFFTKNSLIRGTQEIFWYFTTDSNIFVSLAAIVVVIFDIQIFRGKRTVIPKPVLLCKFAGTVAVMLTMVTCLVYLAPLYGFSFIFGGSFFHMHLTAPLMAFISLCFFEKGERLGFLEAQVGHLPCLVYGVVYFIMVMVIGEQNGGWRDLYHFNENVTWYIAVLLIAAEEIAIFLAVRLVYNIGLNKRSDTGAC